MDSAYEDYNGQIKCIICGAVLDIKCDDGKLSSVRVVETGQRLSERRI
jgi:hypothetical protein